ncbi:hypothetical protein KAR91_44535 [Candidatus Pacearchaeota archaeon]|nr:hypothetical protein [Candidatus Pacearchaeota archaeon]
MLIFQGINPSEIDAMTLEDVQMSLLVAEKMRDQEMKRMENTLRKVLSEVMK